MKTYLILAATALAACSTQKPASSLNSAATTTAKQYECKWSIDAAWQTSNEMHAEETLEVNIDSTDVLSNLQAEQIIAAGKLLGSLEGTDDKLASVFEAADDNALEISTVSKDGKSYDWINYYAGDTQIGVVFEKDTLKVVAQIGDGDVMGCREVDASATKITFAAMMQPLFVPGAVQASKSYHFLGTHEGKACGVSATLQYEKLSHKFSRLDVSVLNGNDHDYLSSFGVGSSDGLIETAGSTADQQVYSVKSDACGSDRSLVASLEAGDSLASLTAVKSTTKSTGCHPSSTVTVHENSCEDLRLILVQTPDTLKTFTSLARAALPASANVINDKRNFGCNLDLSQDGGSIVCNWDISDDFEGDTGDVAMFSYELKDGAPTKVSHLRYEDKYTGEVSDGPF